MKNFDVLLFDLGGVLIDWDGTTPLVELSAGRLDRETARRFWLESPWVTRYDQGQCTLEQFADGVIEELRLNLSRADFIAAYSTWVKAPYPGAEALLLGLSRRYRLATLTNNNATHFARIQQQLNLERYFSQIFASHLIGMKNPIRRSTTTSPNNSALRQSALPSSTTILNA